MNKLINFKVRSLFIMMLAICMGNSVSYAQNAPSIIPAPVSLTMQKGQFTIDAKTAIFSEPAAQKQPFSAEAAFLQKAIKDLSGLALPLQQRTGKIILLKKVQKKDLGDEGYTLDITPNGVTIAAQTNAGIFYGMQSLLQMLPAIRTNAALQLPCLSITDYPLFKWRGMHLDVSRHFFGPEVIKSYIDLMATYKMNTFHWHLVDDQGWRIEIKRYPNLTKTGAWRVNQNHLVWEERPQAKPGEPATYGGYYTQQQVKEIVQYAAMRNITVVPEIEMPGHVASAIASYPHLSCTQQPQLPMTGGNYTNISSNYCAGNDSVFMFLENVLSEVIALFPSAYIHIGGDEVDKGPWKKCARCQQRMQAEHLKNEEELQSYFIRRIEKFINNKGRKMIGWDEILEGGLAPNAVVMSWRGEAGGIEAANMNHDVVMTPGNPLYFDHYQAGPAGEPLAFGGMNTLKKVYDYDPIPAELPQDKARYVLGAQANLWTEHVTKPTHAIYMILPRMLALAETVWLPKHLKNWEEFSTRLQAHFNTFEQRGLHYSPGNYTAAITPVAKAGKLTVNLSTEMQDTDIYYTTDGTEPTMQSQLYTSPIEISSSLVLKASTARYGRMMSTQAARQSFSRHLAMGKEVTYSHPVSNSYKADGPNSLTDGVRGTYTVGKFWHGFSGKDLVATVDLGKPTTVSQIKLGCLHKYKDWIFLPEWVKFEVSADGATFTEAALAKHNNGLQNNETIFDFIANISPTSIRYIRVTAKNNDCPPGHPGAGKPGWIFADEIMVE